MGIERRITKQVEAILLTLLAHLTIEMSGAEIAEAAKLSRGTVLKSGSLYPALIRMEGFGWLTGQWEDIDPREAGRPRRRLYRLTGEGEAVARRVNARATQPVSAPKGTLRGLPAGGAA